MDFLKDVFGSGMNIWGASAPQNTQRMIDAGLLAPDAGEKAQSQSLMRGLLGAGVSYLSQPKNQNYGSALPYIGKALGQGMEQAQKPMDNMYDRAKQNHAMNQISEAKLAKENKSKFESGMFKNNSTIKGFERQADPRLERKDQAGNITQVAPNFNPIQATETPTWDSEKYLQDSLNSKLINSEEYFKYKNLMNPKDEGFTLAADGKRYDSKGRLIASNPKEEQEKLSNDYRIWLEMGGSNSKYKTFPSYIDSKDSGIQITNQMPGGADGTSRAIQDDYDKVFIQSQNDGAALNDQLGDLQQMERLISKAGKTGAGSGLLLGLQKLGARIGVETEGMSSMEAMQALSNKLALGMKKAGTGVYKRMDTYSNAFSNATTGNKS